MKSYKQRYFEKMRVVEKTGKDGKTRREYVYDGDYYGWSYKYRGLDHAALKKMKQLHGLLYAAGAAAYAFGALSRNDVNGNPVVAVPTLLALAAMVIELTGIIEFIISGDRYMEADIQSLGTRLHVSAVLHAAFAFSAAALAALRLFGLRSTDGLAAAFLYLLSGGCASAVAYLQKHLGPWNLGKAPEESTGEK